VIITLQSGVFILGELLQSSRRQEGMGRNILNYLQEQSYLKKEDGLTAVTFIMRMSSWKIS
jgi:hypothetical protein